MTIKTVDDFAEAVIEVLERGWTQGADARDANGKRCLYRSDDAVCWCLSAQ